MYQLQQHQSLPNYFSAKKTNHCLQVWRRQALDALTKWLIEDTQRVEPKLLVKSNIQIMVDMFNSSGPQEALLELCDRMLHCSTKLCIVFGSQVRNL